MYDFFTSLVSSLSSILLSLYYATLRIDFVDDKNLLILKLKKSNFIVVIWHTFVEAAVLCLHSRDLVIYSDHPRTESYEKSISHIAREVGIKTIRSMGFDVVDASLGKQSAGILNFVKKIKAGRPALIAPDGPDGPIYRAKPGAVYMAKKTNSLLLPIGFSASKFITLPNWDDFVLPLPFSRVIMVVGKPLEIGLSLSAEEQKEQTEKLESVLDGLNLRALNLIET